MNNLQFNLNFTGIVDALTTGNHTPQQLIDIILFFQAISIFSYFVSGLFLFQNVYSGFIIIFLGIVLTLFLLFTYRILRIEITRITYGIILGGAVILVFIMLQSAIFWSQYSGCLPFLNPVHSQSYGVHCEYRSAMISVSTFSVFLFCSYLLLIGVMVKYKNDLLGAAPTREGGFASSSSIPVPEASGGVSNMLSNPLYGYPPSAVGRAQLSSGMPTSMDV